MTIEKLEMDISEESIEARNKLSIFIIPNWL